MKKISFILSDYGGVRENLHTPIFLNNQFFDRKKYEIIWVELYNKVNPKLAEYADLGIIDKLYIMNSPKTRFQKRQLTYNQGIILSEGELVCFLDADVMCSVNFINRIIWHFNMNPESILFIDEIRHAQKEEINYKEKIEDFYPFITKNWINWDFDINKTFGISFLKNRFKRTWLNRNEVEIGCDMRNYGACMTAWRNDILKVHGADEYSGFDGLYGGPWEMGWRILNANNDYTEHWHPDEFILHVAHQGTDGTDYDNCIGQFPGEDKMIEGEPYHTSNIKMNYYGFRHLRNGNIFPYVPNEKIK